MPKERDARITAIALSMIALTLFIISIVFFGIGNWDARAIMGLGGFAHLTGILFSSIAGSISIGALVFSGLSCTPAPQH